MYNSVGGLGFAKLKENVCLKFLCACSLLDFKAGCVRLIHVVYSHVAWYVLLSIPVIVKLYISRSPALLIRLKINLNFLYDAGTT